MQFTQAFALLALAPFMAFANPVTIDRSHELVRRGGIDYCGSNLKAVGGACSFGSSESEPHACDVNNETRVVSYFYQLVEG